jgi:hypothetical protein
MTRGGPGSGPAAVAAAAGLFLSLGFVVASAEAPKAGSTSRVLPARLVPGSSPGRTADAGPWRLSADPVFSVGGSLAPGPASFGDVEDIVRLSSGEVVVADARAGELRYFGSDGEWLHSAGGRGPGPEEFLSIASIGRFRGDSVFVFHGQKSYLSAWAPDGSFGRTVPLSDVRSGRFLPRSFACGDRGTLAFVHSRQPEPPGEEGPHRPRVPISVVGPDGDVRELGTFAATERYFFRNPDGTGTDRPRPLGKRTSVAVHDGRIFVGTGDAFEIEVFSVDGEHVGPIRDTVTRVELTGERLDTYVDHQVSLVEDDRRRAVRRFFEGLEYPDRAPAHLDLVAGDDGHLWVEEFHLPGEPATRRVYRPAGGRVASVEMPRGFTLMAAGADFVLGVWRDELDVDHVRMYRILRE